MNRAIGVRSDTSKSVRFHIRQTEKPIIVNMLHQRSIPMIMSSFSNSLFCCLPYEEIKNCSVTCGMHITVRSLNIAKGLVSENFITILMFLYTCIYMFSAFLFFMLSYRKKPDECIMNYNERKKKM